MKNFGDVITVHLDDVNYFEILSGLWTGKRPPYVKAGVIRNTNFTSSGEVDYSDVAWLDVEEKQLAKRILKTGDIIIERSGGGPKQPVGRVVQFRCSEGVFSFSNFTTTVRIKNPEVLNPLFAFYILQELYQSGRTDDIQRRTTGLRNLDFKAYKERAIFPLIPISEQRRIAQILTVVQTSIQQQTQLIALTRELKSAIVGRLLTEGLRGEKQKKTEIGLVPESWEITNIGKVANLQTGGTPSRDNPDYWVGGTIPWVKTTEINYREIINPEEKITNAGLENSATKILPKGTLLMAMYGQGVTRGRVGILGLDAATNQACVAIMPLDENNILTKYLYYYLEFHYLRVRELGHGANQRNLNMDLIKSFPCSFPDVGVQREIINTLSIFDDKLSLVEHKKHNLEELFRTLLHQLMTGQIRVNDLELAQVSSGEMG